MLFYFKFSPFMETKSPISYFCDIVRSVIHDITRVREFNSSWYRMRSLFMHLPPNAEWGEVLSVMLLLASFLAKPV